MLLLAGESGQGKTWQLANLATSTVLGEGLVVLVKTTGDAEDDLAAAAKILWQDGLHCNQALSMDRIAQYRREVVPESAMPWLTVCIDDVQSAQQARRLVDQDWESWGIRLAMTLPPAVGWSLQTNYGDRVHLVEVPDFTSDELRKYLQYHNRSWEAVPEDVRATLHRPLLAHLYRRLTQDASWAPTNEYALFEKYWQRIKEAHEQADFPHDLGKMQRLVSRILQEHATYPWPPEVLLEVGIDDPTWKRLEAIGWLRRLGDGRVEIWHDRLLNWAVAEALLEQRQHNHLSTAQLGEWLCTLYDPRNTFAGKALAYIPMDVLWLASDQRRGLVTDVPGVIAALDEHPVYGGYPESLYQTLLPTLGTRVLPALIERVRMTATEEFNLYPQFVAATFIQIGTQYPQIVQEHALQLIREQLPALQQIGIRVLARLPCAAPLDRLWELHKQHVQICSNRQDPQSHLRYFLYEISCAALRACIPMQPAWLLRTIRYANAQEEPVADLAYLMTNVEEAQAARLWREVKTKLFTDLLPEKPRALINCICKCRDRDALPNPVSWLQEPQDWASPAALATLAWLDPEEALLHLAEIPLAELSSAPGWWLPLLLHTRPEQTRARLRTLMHTP